MDFGSLGAMGNTAQAMGQGLGLAYGSDAQEKGFDTSNKILQALAMQLAEIGTPQFEKFGGESPLQSAYGQNPEDPNDRANQLKVFDALMNIFSQGGMDPQSKAQYLAATDAANQQQTGQAAAMKQGLAQRGLGNSGLALAAQMGAAQNQGQQMGNMGVQIAGDANNRRMQALAGAGQIAGSLRGQDWAEINAKSQAQNALNQWNAEFARQAQMLNNQSMQQQFGDQMQKFGAGAQVGEKQADNATEQGNQRYQRDVNIGNWGGQTANNLIGGWGSYFGGMGGG